MPGWSEKQQQPDSVLRADRTLSRGRAPGLSASLFSLLGLSLVEAGEVALGIACSSAWLLRPPPTQTPPLLAGAGPPGQAGAALRQADNQQGFGVPPLKLGLTSLGPSPETGLTGSD